MTPERWQRIKPLLQSALELEPAERSAFLATECAGDQALRKDVESLIASHERAGDFIESPAVEFMASSLGEQTDSLAGQSFGPYQIIARIGSGGMGEVYLAQDSRLGRKVALKMLPDHFTKDEERVGRFRQEARAASALNHPNILTIYEIGQIDSRHFIATEFIEGETLREHMAKTKMKIDETLDIAGQVASALSAAHQAGIAHRDVKPGNIMLRPDGVVKVLDFGLAKLTEQKGDDLEAAGLVNTKQGIVMGTAHYMSPEQARGLPVDARTDVWSLGVVLYEMITGRVPFSGPTMSDVIASILNKDAPPLAEYPIPAELERIVSKALSKIREERYQVIKELGLDLKSLRQRLEFEAELARSAQSQSKREAAAVTQSGGHGTATSSAVPTTPPASSAEYLRAEIKTVFEPDISTRSVVPRKQLFSRPVFMIILLAVAALIVGFMFVWKSQTKPTKEIKSIAVLPFNQIGEGDRDETLEFGMVDTLITRLSNLERLIVRPTSAVFKYSGQKPDAVVVGRELKVDAVLEGSIQRSGEHVRVTVRLISTDDGSSLWAEHFDTAFTDIFALQDLISEQTVRALTLELSGRERELMAKHSTGDPQAYRLYLTGRFFFNKRGSLESLKKSIGYYEQAIAIDPNYALAYAGLADCYQLLGEYLATTPEEGFKKAREAAKRALEIDNQLAEAHTSLAYTLAFYDWDFVGAEREFKRALELDPNYPTAHQWYGEFLLAMGRFDEAKIEHEKTLQIDPTSLVFNVELAAYYYTVRQFDQAITQAQTVIEMEPDYAFGYVFLCFSYGQKGMKQQAAEAYIKTVELFGEVKEAKELRKTLAEKGVKATWLKRIEQVDSPASRKSFSAHWRALIHIWLGEKERALDWLEISYERRDRWMINVKYAPEMDSLRSEPRFQVLMQRVGL